MFLEVVSKRKIKPEGSIVSSFPTKLKVAMCQMSRSTQEKTNRIKHPLLIICVIRFLFLLCSFILNPHDFLASGFITDATLNKRHKMAPDTRSSKQIRSISSLIL